MASNSSHHIRSYNFSFTVLDIDIPVCKLQRIIAIQLALRAGNPCPCTCGAITIKCHQAVTSHAVK